MYYVGMENRKAVTVKLPPDLLDEVNRLRQRMAPKPTFTACVEQALMDWTASCHYRNAGLVLRPVSITKSAAKVEKKVRK